MSENTEAPAPTPRAFGDRILVKQVLPVTTTPSGLIHLPDSKIEWPPVATVLEIGPQVTLEVAVGDRVLFKRRPDTDVEIGIDGLHVLPNGSKERRLMLRESKGDIIAVLEGEGDVEILEPTVRR